MIFYLLTLLTFCRAKDINLNIQGFNSFGTSVNTTAEKATKELEDLFKTSMNSAMILDEAEKDAQATEEPNQMGAALADAEQQAITGQNNSFPKEEVALPATFAPPPDTGDEDFNNELDRREADLDNEFVVKNRQSVIFYRGIALGAKHSIEAADYLIEESRRAQQNDAKKLWDAEEALKYQYNVKSNKDWKADFDRLQEINRLQKSVYLQQHASAEHYAQVELAQSIWNENIFRTVAAEKQEFEAGNRRVHQHQCRQLVYLLEEITGPGDTPCHECAYDESEELDSCSYRRTVGLLPQEGLNPVAYHGATDFASARAECWSKGSELRSAASTDDFTALSKAGLEAGFKDTDIWVGLYKPRTSANYHTTVDDIQQTFNPLPAPLGLPEGAPGLPAAIQGHTLCILLNTGDGEVHAAPCYHDKHDYLCN